MPLIFFIDEKTCSRAKDARTDLEKGHGKARFQFRTLKAVDNE